jgi:hypothetical protein
MEIIPKKEYFEANRGSFATQIFSRTGSADNRQNRALPAS